MKIAIASDLHVEFEPNRTNPPEWPDADILILAGDITLASKIKQSTYKVLFDEVSSRYKTVFYVPGNHEYYGSYTTTMADERIKKFITSNYDNILFGNPAYIRHDGYSIIMATLWTQMTYMQELEAPGVMNDYRCVTGLTPPVVSQIHRDHLDFIKRETLEQTIVITHHAPSKLSVAPKFEGNRYNYLFHSNLDHLFCPEIPLWVHGHMHSACDYTSNGTRVVCNPRGYPRENPEYRVKVIEI